MAQGVAQTWVALYTALQGLFTQTGQLVCQGEPGVYTPDLIIAMTGLRGPITQPTAGTNRSRDKRVQIDVVISALQSGGPEAHPMAIAAAWTAADAIETYLRTGSNPTLGGACYNAYAETENLMLETQWERFPDVDEPVPIGRIAQIDLVVTAWIRI